MNVYCQGDPRDRPGNQLYLYKELRHQLRLAESTGIFQATQSPQLLDGGKQRVVVVGGRAVNEMLVISGCEHQSGGIGTAKHDAIDTRWAMATTIGAGVIILHSLVNTSAKPPDSGLLSITIV